MNLKICSNTIIVLAILMWMNACIKPEEKEIGFDIRTPNGTCLTVDPVAETCGSKYVGYFNYEEASTAFIPYLTGGETLVFMDSLDQETTFKIESITNFIKYESSDYYTCDNPNLYVQVCREMDAIDVRLVNEAWDIVLFIRLVPQIYINQFDQVFVGDFLKIIRYVDEPFSFSPQYEILINQRDYPADVYQARAPHSVAFHEEFEIIGKSFPNVYTDSLIYYFGTPSLFDYYYNQEEGLVGFKDPNGKTWRLDRRE